MQSTKCYLWLDIVLRKTMLCLLVFATLLVSISSSPSLFAQQRDEDSPLAAILNKKGDLSLQDTSMEKALIAIGATWNVNVVVGKDIQGTISCVYHQTPLHEVLDAILLANGYSYRAVGDSIVIQKATEVGSANPLFESAAIPIENGDLGEIVEATQLLISKQGQVRSLPSARSVLVIDYKDRVESIRQFIAKMDAAALRATSPQLGGSYKQLTVAYFHTQYIPVDNAREPIASVLSQLGRVSTMPLENRLVVVDYAANIDVVRKVLEKIDRPRPQVRITALIYDISLKDAEKLGVNWDHDAKGRNLDASGDAQQVLSFDSTTVAPFATGSSGGTMTFKSLTRNFDLNAVALLLQTAGDSRLLADPNVTVVDNETAEWRSVSEIPFQQITQSELGGQIGTTAFKPVGITLRVKATIAADQTIEMLVEPEFSRLAGFTEGDGQPIVDTRSATTVVRIANRQTLVIGGLRQRSDTGDFNGIPGLKDIKYLGNLFRSRDTTVQESELIVFIMPEIVDYDQDSHHREYMAEETIGCRLASIPKAEGCNTGGCSGAFPSDRLLQLPSVDSGVPAYMTSQYEEKEASPNSERLIFREPFEDRYRARGGFESPKQRVPETASNPRAKKSAKRSYLERMFGS